MGFVPLEKCRHCNSLMQALGTCEGGRLRGLPIDRYSNADAKGECQQGKKRRNTAALLVSGVHCTYTKVSCLGVVLHLNKGRVNTVEGSMIPSTEQSKPLSTPLVSRQCDARDFYAKHTRTDVILVTVVDVVRAWNVDARALAKNSDIPSFRWTSKT